VSTDDELMTSEAERLRKVAERRHLWEAWHQAFWETVEQRLGNKGSSGGLRFYDDVYVIVQPVEEGVLHLGVCRSPRPAEREFAGYGFSFRWEDFEPATVADRALGFVDKVRADPFR